MERYSEYKDSGVKWLGQIPRHWEVIKTSRIFSYIGSGTTPKSGSEDYYTQNGIPFLQTGDLNDGYVTDTSKRITEKALRDTNLKIHPKGSLIVAMYGATIGKLGILDIDATVNQACCVLTKSPIIETKFAFYTYLAAKKDLIFQSKGGGQPNISQDTIRSERIPVPPIKEQEAIANYLDAATSKIDEAIAQQQKMIDLLNERKHIIINSTVTKGLDPNVPMKDSGVEWIGEVPEHWEVRRLSSLGSFSKGGNISRDDLQKYGKGAILYGDIYTKYNIQTLIVKNHISEKVAKKSMRISKGDILMTGSGETKEDIGKTIVFNGEEAFIGGDVILFRQEKNNSTFLSYALNSQYAKGYRYRESKGEIIVHIYASSLKRLFLALPPIEEQIKVVKYLDGQIDAIESEIGVINKQISLLQERKQIIINDAVTGKVKVV